MPTDAALRLAVARVAAGQPLSSEETRAAFAEVMAGDASTTLVGALLIGLRARGETAEELAGAALALREAMVPVSLPGTRLVDTCGTGGGAIRTLNISTAAALVAAGAGVAVVKHGNRSFTSRCGSADVFEALGVPVELAPSQAARVFAEAGMVFLYAPRYHPAMRHVAPVRRELGVATLMNLVGPLANPAQVTRQVVGVAEPRHGRLIADALARMGAEHALVVHAAIGLDEIAPVGMTAVWEVRGGEVVEWHLDPATHGLATGDLAGLEGGEPAENATAITALLRHPGAAAPALRAAVLLNAAAAIYVSGSVADIAEGVTVAVAALESGRAADRLERLQRAVAVRTSG